MSKNLIRGYLLGCRAPKEILDALEALSSPIKSIPQGDYNFDFLDYSHPNCRCVIDSMFVKDLKMKPKKKKSKK